MTGPQVATSRPLRAIVIILFLWAGGRAMYECAPLIIATEQTPSVASGAVVTGRQPPPVNSPAYRDPAIAAAVLPKPGITDGPRGAVARRPESMDRSPTPYRKADVSTAPQNPPSPADGRALPVQTEIEVRSQTGARRNLTLSSWLLVRDGAAGIAPAGTLGGSQIGARVYRSIAQNVAVTARISAPLRTSGAEASVGFAVHQGPAKLLLERRISLQRGGRDDFSVTLAAGIDGVRLPRQFRLDAYGQAGIVGRDGFADGAVRVDRRVFGHGKTDIALGVGAWGGTQPGLARIDVGPQLVVRMPIAGGYLRASGEWRQRILGKAQPASGPALTLGMDF